MAKKWGIALFIACVLFALVGPVGNYLTKGDPVLSNVLVYIAPILAGVVMGRCYRNGGFILLPTIAAVFLGMALAGIIHCDLDPYFCAIVDAVFLAPGIVIGVLAGKYSHRII